MVGTPCATLHAYSGLLQDVSARWGPIRPSAYVCDSIVSVILLLISWLGHWDPVWVPKVMSLLLCVL